MPNPGKPHALKVISGSRRMTDAAPTVSAFPVISVAPSAPDWLPNAHAVREWNRLAPLLVANKLLTEPALQILGHTCAVHGAIVQCLAAGQQPKAALVGVYRGLLNDFGLTPVARRNVDANSAPTSNRFAKNGSRALRREEH